MKMKPKVTGIEPNASKHQQSLVSSLREWLSLQITCQSVIFRFRAMDLLPIDCGIPTSPKLGHDSGGWCMMMEVAVSAGVCIGTVLYQRWNLNVRPSVLPSLFLRKRAPLPTEIEVAFQKLQHFVSVMLQVNGRVDT